MKRKSARLRPSPNEEARIIREEYERRRKLRIQQVREQQRYIALQIRQAVDQRRQHELEQLEKELRQDWERQQREKLNHLQKLYQESLQLLGQGHRSAEENEPDFAAIAQKEEENHTKAEERYREALRELKSHRHKDHERQRRVINARKKALQTEKERSAKVASLPLPPPNPLQNIDSKKPHVVKKSNVNAFAATHYHMSERMVDKEVDPNQPSAHEGAELEVRRLQELQREEQRKREEHLEKARLRGKQALRMEHLEQDRERLLVELEHMQQTDMLRRRKQVSKMPAQIFQPLCKRQETRENLQREMEFAFEDMYTGERRVKGDLVVQLVPEPLPIVSTGSQDQELDVTLDEITTTGSENSQHDSEQEPRITEQETSAQVEPSNHAPRRALKKLLDRIRSQRNQWTEHNSHVPPFDSPTVITDEIPERDTTINTGSLTSEEREKPSPIELPEPSHSPPALETEQSPVADTLFPDAFANRIEEFTEERKKREEELERQKQEQVVLLQELEEQKAKLEEMLLEARQEREDLKAAVTQEAPVNQPEIPICDQEVTSIVPVTLVPPPGEDDHTRRIREYQQRLLEQNRVHQRSVEVARQRLAEYQRALQIRYMAATPLHVKPQTPAERESDHLDSPPHPPGSSLRVCSRLLPNEVESISGKPRNQTPDMSGWLTDSIMKRVTEHLPERVKPLSVAKGPLLFKPLTAHQPTSDPIPAVSITRGPPLVLGHTALEPWTLPDDSVLTGSSSSREEDMERQRQRQELMVAQRRVLEQREALVQQQRQQEIKRQKEELMEAQRRVMQQQEEEKQELMEAQRRVMEQRQQEEERQKEELMEVQRRVMEEKEAVVQRQQEEERQKEELMEAQRRVMQQQRQQEEKRRKQELMEVKRRMMEQRQKEEERQKEELMEAQRRVMQQQRQQEEKRRKQELMEVQRRMMEQRQQEEERQKQELMEVQRRVIEQREAVVQQQRQQEEKRQKQEVEMEQMRRQKETLQALIHTDVPPVPDDATDALVSENICQIRRKLLASLLKAIEDTNGGTLSHLEDPQEEDGSTPQPPANSVATDPISQSSVAARPSPVSVLPSGFLLPPRAAKPPVTRIRLGVTEMMTQPHELSAIPEVETPVNVSQVAGPEDSARVLSHAVDWYPLAEFKPTVPSDRTLQTPTSSGTSSERSSFLIWRERLLRGAGTSPESSEADSRMISPLSSDSGRGADYSGPAMTSYRSPTEPAQQTPNSDRFSSTTISTGSYITTDPEQNVNTDKSPSFGRCEGQGADLFNVSSPSSSCVKDGSAAENPARAVETLFNDSSIQRIIDRYTKELNMSLSTTGKLTADSGGSYVEEPGSSVSQQSWEERSEKAGSSAVCQSRPSDTADTQRRGLLWEGTINPIPAHISGEDTSQAEGQEQDSFTPLIGQLTDQSSCLAADHRDSAMERLVGQPSAHSSMISQLPGLPLPVSPDQSSWDSTLNRMIGRLTRQSGSHWLSGGQDFYAGQLVGQMLSGQSTIWSDEGPEESRMRPLVAELDETAGRHSGSSGERTCAAFGVSADASVPSHPALPSEASSHSASVPAVNPYAQDQTSTMDLGPERTEALDSFHPLLAEVTHNETADPSLTFHHVPHSPEGRPASWDRSLPPEESETHDESGPSPERFRTEELMPASPASHESFCQLVTSQQHPHESVLTLLPTTKTDVELTALSLSNLTMCDDTPVVNTPQPEVPSSDVSAGELKPEGGSSLRNDLPVSEKMMEAESEKGILEQSMITLVSLTDSTLQDQDTTVVDEEGSVEDKDPDGTMVEEQKGQEMKETVTKLLLDETTEDKKEPLPATLLEFQWGPSGGLQDIYQRKRRALLQRSSHRVEEIKAKRAGKMEAQIQAPSETREQSKVKDCHPPVACKANTKGGRAEQHQTTLKSCFNQKTQLPAPGSDSRLKRVDEMKTCTPEQRKLEVSEMHQRTQRLYEQLEEVKHQKAIRSRQEAYAKNRLKAKEFHKKTLQKLRAKQ